MLRLICRQQLVPRHLHKPQFSNQQEVGCPALSTIAKLLTLHGISERSCADGTRKHCYCQRLTLQAEYRVQARVRAYLGPKVTIVSVWQCCRDPGVKADSITCTT